MRAPWLDADCSTGDIGAGARTSATDTYQIVGLAPGTPVAFFAELLVQGSVFLYGHCAFPQSGSVSASLESGDGEQDEVRAGAGLSPPNCSGTPDAILNSTLRIPLEGTSDTEFQLHMEVQANVNWGSAGLRADGLMFSGLPQGATVISCQGFRQDVPVQTLSASWGSVKAHYR